MMQMNLVSDVVSGLWGLLGWVAQEIQHAFFNQSPTTAYNPAENSQAVDGVVTGDLHAVDTDGDPLSFTVIQAPQNGSVVINPDGRFAYTPSAELAATGGADQFVVKVVDQGFHLHGLLGFFQPDFGHSTTTVVAVSVDPVAHVVIDTIQVGFDAQPIGIAVSPDGAHAYVTNFSDGTVSVIDTATNTVAATITVDAGFGPNSVAVSPDGTLTYVTDEFFDTVTVIDLATNTVSTTIPVGLAANVGPNGWRSAPTAPPSTSPTPPTALAGVEPAADRRSDRTGGIPAAVGAAGMGAPLDPAHVVQPDSDRRV